MISYCREGLLGSKKEGRGRGGRREEEETDPPIIQVFLTGGRKRKLTRLLYKYSSHTHAQSIKVIEVRHHVTLISLPTRDS